MESNRLARYTYPLLILVGIQFCISLAILLLASTTDISAFPVWIGAVDVGLVVTLLITIILLKLAVGWQKDARAIRRSYVLMTYLVPVGIVLIWFFREQLLLNTLLPGLAWRMYVLFEGLPATLTIFSKPDS